MLSPQLGATVFYKFSCMLHESTSDRPGPVKKSKLASRRERARFLLSSAHFSFTITFLG